MGAILSFCKGVVLLDVVGSVQLFELIAVLLLEVWILLLYEIRGVLKHVTCTDMCDGSCSFVKYEICAFV